jgi:hypothetical protein
MSGDISLRLRAATFKLGRDTPGVLGLDLLALGLGGAATVELMVDVVAGGGVKPILLEARVLKAADETEQGSGAGGRVSPGAQSTSWRGNSDAREWPTRSCSPDSVAGDGYRRS